MTVQMQDDRVRVCYEAYLRAYLLASSGQEVVPDPGTSQQRDELYAMARGVYDAKQNEPPQPQRQVTEMAARALLGG